jgi:uncharacterized protein (DUF1015 family)
MNISAFKAVFPKVDLIKSPDSFFSNIKYQYNEYRNSGFYIPEKKEGIYIYQIKTKKSSYTGFLCCTDIDDLRKQKVLKHEQTLAAKEQQMMHLLLQRKALVKPVLLGYKSFNGVEKIIKSTTEKEKAVFKIEFENNEIHSIWRITSKKIINEIVDKFKNLESSYIADGHHRSTTVLLLNSSKDLGKESKKYNQLLTAYFPFEELEICDYNRVVDIADIMPTSQFIAELSQYYDINLSPKAVKPKSKHELSFYIDKRWYLMTWKKPYLKSEKDSIILDSAMINEYVFDKILGIKDIRIDTRISYYAGTEGLAKIVKHADKRGVGIGICIYPVSVDELTELADQNKTLPPKSTWFLPRLKSGIIAKDL